MNQSGNDVLFIKFMVCELLIVLINYNSNHRVDNRGDGFYHGGETVSCFIMSALDWTLSHSG